MDINIQNIEEETLLHFAVKEGRPDVVQFLIDNGVNIDTKNIRGETPLHLAYRQLELARLVIKTGVDKKTKIRHRKKSLEQIALINEQLIQLLIDNGADINAKNTFGETPLYFSTSREGKLELVQLLIKSWENKKLQQKRRRPPFYLQGITEELVYLHTQSDSLKKKVIFKLLNIIHSFQKKGCREALSSLSF